MVWEEGTRLTKMWSLPPEQLTIRWGTQSRQSTEDTHTHTHTHTHTQERRDRKPLSEGFRRNPAAWSRLLEPKVCPAHRYRVGKASPPSPVSWIDGSLPNSSVEILTQYLRT